MYIRLCRNLQNRKLEQLRMMKRNWNSRFTLSSGTAAAFRLEGRSYLYLGFSGESNPLRPYIPPLSRFLSTINVQPTSYSDSSLLFLHLLPSVLNSASAVSLPSHISLSIKLNLRPSLFLFSMLFSRCRLIKQRRLIQFLCSNYKPTYP